MFYYLKFYLSHLYSTQSLPTFCRCCLGNQVHRHRDSSPVGGFDAGTEGADTVGARQGKPRPIQLPQEMLTLSVTAC